MATEQLLATPETGHGEKWIDLDDVLTKVGLHIKHWLIILICGLGYGHYTALTLAQALATKYVWITWPELKHRPVYYNLIFAVTGVARLLGALFLLPWCDRLGRKPFFFWGVVVSTILGVISSFSPSFPIYCLLRGVVCLSISVLPAVTSVYALEMVPIRARGIPGILNQTISCCYILICTFINTAIDNSDRFSPTTKWRWALSLFMTPSIIVLIILPSLNLETPRFEAANKRRPDLAWKTISSLCPGGKPALLEVLKTVPVKDGPLEDGPTTTLSHFSRLEGVSYRGEFSPKGGQMTPKSGRRDKIHSFQMGEHTPRTEITDASESRISLKSSAWPSSGFGSYRFYGIEDRPEPPKRSICGDVAFSLRQMSHLCTSKLYRGETFWIALCWIMQSFSHWGLSNYVTVFFTYIGINPNWSTSGAFAVQLPSQIICYWIMQRGRASIGHNSSEEQSEKKWGGRILAIQIYATLCAVSHLILAFLLLSGYRGSVPLTIFSLGCYFFGGPIWGPLYSYTAERYPTVLRASAMGFFACVAALSVIATTYVGSVTLSESNVWLYPLIWGILRSTLAVISYFFKEETNHARLGDKELRN